MRKFLFLFLTFSCLLTGCSTSQTKEQSTDDTENLDAYF